MLKKMRSIIRQMVGIFVVMVVYMFVAASMKYVPFSSHWMTYLKVGPKGFIKAYIAVIISYFIVNWIYVIYRKLKDKFSSKKES